MIGRIVEIAQDGRHLAIDRGFMTVNEKGVEVGRVPLDDIGMVIVNAHGTTYSNNLVLKLAERGAGVVLCGPNHLPVAWLWPVVGHHDQARRLRAQIEASKPLTKRLWQTVIKAKIRQQGAVLDALGKPGGGFELMAARVNSGDPDNMEAQAARRYWPLLMGEDFRRDRESGGTNGLLNYGYTVLRSATARAVCAAGLHPSIGMQHRNGDMSLVDDLMEPFRPMVDLVVARLIAGGATDVSRDARRALADVASLDMRTDKGRTPVYLCLERLAASLGKSYESGKPALDLPLAPLPLELPAVDAGEADDGAAQEA
jgi:CRISPR-associated protein Cas1